MNPNGTPPPPWGNGHPTPQVPRHVAIIMDGNGRWAQERGLPRLAGHRAGTENIPRVVRTFYERGVRYLTLYAFSTENWSRPPDEVQGLMDLLQEVLRREVDVFDREGVRLLHLGRLDRVPDPLRQAIQDALRRTAHNPGLTLAIAFDYGGRDEILRAVRRLLEERIPPEALDEALFARYLYTADLPDPDLVIRTAGEMRLSNFLLWQSAYAEFYSTPVYWPDFDEAEIDRALQAYACRQRRFGGLVARPTP